MNIKLLIPSAILILIIFSSLCTGSTSKYDLPENQTKMEKLGNVVDLIFIALCVFAILYPKPKYDKNSSNSHPNPDKIFNEEYEKQVLKNPINKLDIIYVFITLTALLASIFFLKDHTNLTHTLIGLLLLVVSFFLFFLGMAYYGFKRDRNRKNALKITLDKTDGLRPIYYPAFPPKVFVYVLIILIILFLVLDRFYFT